MDLVFLKSDIFDISELPVKRNQQHFHTALRTSCTQNISVKNSLRVKKILF